MKKIIFLSVTLILFSCWSKKITIKSCDETKLQEIVTTYNLYFKAVYKQASCGGKEIPIEYLLFNDVKNTEIKFKYASDTNVVYSARTDSNGLFNIKLPLGKWRYYITEEFAKENSNQYSNIPKKCDRFYNIPYGTIIIEYDSTTNKISAKNLSFYHKIKSLNNKAQRDSLFFYLPCNPCDLSTKP